MIFSPDHVQTRQCIITEHNLTEILHRHTLTVRVRVPVHALDMALGPTMCMDCQEPERGE